MGNSQKYMYEKRHSNIYYYFISDAIMTSTGMEYPMGPLGPPPTGTSGQPGTFPRGAKKNQCESSPSLTSISSDTSPALSSSSSSLSSSNGSVILGNEYRKRVTSDSFMEIRRPRHGAPCTTNSSPNTTNNSTTKSTVILQSNSKAVSSANKTTDEADSDLQTLSIVASGLVLFPSLI